MKGLLTGDRVIFGTDALPELYETLHYGRLKGDKLELALVEAAYLIDREKITVEADGTPLDFPAFFIKASQAQEYFEVKYIVYRDLRERGYYVQPGVTDFRVFPRGGKPNLAASRYFVHVISERKPLPMAEIIANLQATLNVRKEMVLAIVDEESDITYYGVKMATLTGGMSPPDVKPKAGQRDAARRPGGHLGPGNIRTASRPWLLWKPPGRETASAFAGRSRVPDHAGPAGGLRCERPGDEPGRFRGAGAGLRGRL